MQHKPIYISGFLIAFSVLIAITSCTSVKVENVQKGKSLKKAEICSAETALLELLRRPKIGLSKTDTGYNNILFEDENYIYWGYLRLDNWLNRVVEPFYKTPKADFIEAKRKSNGMSSFLADAIVSNWFLKNYPEYNVDSIKTVNRKRLSFIENQNNLYDTRVIGEYEYYYQKLEKSDDPKIDSVMTYPTIKKYVYDCLIGDNKEIIKMDVK